MIQLQCYGQTVLTKGSKSKVENISTIITTVKIKTEVELGEWPKVILNFFLFFLTSFESIKQWLAQPYFKLVLRTNLSTIMPSKFKTFQEKSGNIFC